jgi:hypothetical protein
MKIELTPANSAALTKYAALAGRTPTEFLNRYLDDNMVALFENIRSGELESHLSALEYRTRADAERVIDWMEKRVSERSGGRTAFEAETVKTRRFLDRGKNNCQRIDLSRLDGQAEIFSTQHPPLLPYQSAAGQHNESRYRLCYSCRRCTQNRGFEDYRSYSRRPGQLPQPRCAEFSRTRN